MQGRWRLVAVSFGQGHGPRSHPRGADSQRVTGCGSQCGSLQQQLFPLCGSGCFRESDKSSGPSPQENTQNIYTFNLCSVSVGLWDVWGLPRQQVLFPGRAMLLSSLVRERLCRSYPHGPRVTLGGPFLHLWSSLREGSHPPPLTAPAWLMGFLFGPKEQLGGVDSGSCLWLSVASWEKAPGLEEEDSGISLISVCYSPHDLE